MDTNQKLKLGRVLGSICIVVGAVNLIFYVMDRPNGSALLATGIGALSGGFLIIALSTKKPSGDKYLVRCRGIPGCLLKAGLGSLSPTPVRQ